VGLAGPRGPEGLRGLAGPRGPVGPQGSAGSGLGLVVYDATPNLLGAAVDLNGTILLASPPLGVFVQFDQNNIFCNIPAEGPAVCTSAANYPRVLYPIFPSNDCSGQAYIYDSQPLYSNPDVANFINGYPNNPAFPYVNQFLFWTATTNNNGVPGPQGLVTIQLTGPSQTFQLGSYYNYPNGATSVACFTLPPDVNNPHNVLAYPITITPFPYSLLFTLPVKLPLKITFPGTPPL